MRKTFTFLMLAIMAITPLMAQENNTEAAKETPKGTWATTSTPALKVDQKYYDNWASSGNSLIALTTTFFGDYKYTHSKFIWDNVADLAFGYTWQDLDGDTNCHGFQKFDSRRKSEDKIDLTSTFSMRMKNDWNVNASANFKSQFGAGYNYLGIEDDNRVLVSKFMAPAYLTTSIGFELKRENWNIALSFLTGKSTFVLDDSLIAQGYNYGVEEGKHAYFGLGSYVKFFYKKDIAKNLNLFTRLEFFYDYRKPHVINWNDFDNLNEEQQGIEGFLRRRAYESDLDLEVKLDYRFSSFLSAYLSVNAKFDTDFANLGKFNHWQVYQSAGLQIYFNWKTPTTK